VFKIAKAISFFTGAGGLDIGIHKAGFDVKLSVELVKTYCETLKKNHPSWNVQQGDILDMSVEKMYEDAGMQLDEEIDLIVGGSPCQTFSTIGKRQAFSDPRGEAMLKFAELISESKPKAFLLENVRGLLSASLKQRPTEQRGEGFSPLAEDEMNGSAVKYLFSQFKGYNVQYKLINSADYGVPQKRERVFIIGIRDDLKTPFEYPIETHNKDGTNGKKTWLTFADVMKKSKFVTHTHSNYSKQRLRFMQMIPVGGGNWRDLVPYGEDIVKEALGGAYTSGGGKVGFYRRIHLDRPSPTLLTSPIQKSTNLGHPLEDRPLSIEEYIAIQEFPKGYYLEGSITQKYTQIGNAVPIRLAEIIGAKILETIEKNDRKKA
jgi:DNA (cytosine-5)-methyltransferase 1